MMELRFLVRGLRFQLVNLKYVTNLNTIAGKLTFSNKSTLIKVKGKYKIKWDNSFIYPKLKKNQKIRVTTLKAKRGAIYDRNKNILAKDAKAYSIGIVSGSIKSDDDLKTVGKLLNISYKNNSCFSFAFKVPFLSISIFARFNSSTGLNIVVILKSPTFLFRKAV